MIKETIEKNAEVKVNSKEMEVLKKYFPSCFDKDGRFDIKVFEMAKYLVQYSKNLIK